jgi:outer membrane protein OmpA-like peptidoglycan-associated protein
VTKKTILIMAFSLISFSLFAQNLVLNPSFEEIDRNSTKYSFALRSVKDWSGSWNETYHFHRDLKDEGYWGPIKFQKSAVKLGYKAPFNFLGTQKARTGEAYVAMGGDFEYYEFDHPGTDSGGGIYGRFESVLKRNTIYRIEFFVSLPDRVNVSPDTVYVALKDSSFGMEQYFRNVPPKAVISVTNIEFSEENWQKVSGTFIAEGGEKYLAIGISPRARELKENRRFFLYIDDVSVKEVKDTLIIEPDKALILKNIVFTTGSADLLSQSIPELEKLQNYLLMHSETKLEISGHTDNTGKEENNRALSQKRAEAVVKYLVGKGIKERRLSAKGFGEEKPISSNETEEGKSKNRRVEVKIIK